ncbi:MAG TPA: DinB family protein [Ktedonobacteraceae bacterium]|nr:DinB family protein [Ktedonobacteraceae bacterium]
MTAITALRAINDRLNASLRQVVEELTDEQLLYRAPAIDERSLEEVAFHAYESLLEFAATVEGKPWPAAPVVPDTAAGIISQLNEMSLMVDEILMALPESALEQEVTLLWGQQIKGLDAIADGLEHGLIHVGTIKGIRAIGGFPTPPETY